MVSLKYKNKLKEEKCFSSKWDDCWFLTVGSWLPFQLQICNFNCKSHSKVIENSPTSSHILFLFCDFLFMLFFFFFFFFFFHSNLSLNEQHRESYLKLTSLLPRCLSDTKKPVRLQNKLPTNRSIYFIHRGSPRQEKNEQTSNTMKHSKQSIDIMALNI